MPSSASSVPSVTSAPSASSVPAVPSGMQPFLVAGTSAIVAGGVVAAITGPTGWDDGSWVAAFAVLVTGVGQIGLGAGQLLLAGPRVSGRQIVGEVAAINGGSCLVIIGTLTSTPVVVTLGGLVLVAGLVVFAVAARGGLTTRHWVRSAYLGLLAVLVFSTPIGLVLAWLRA